MAAVICSLIGVVSGKEMAVNMKLKAEMYDNGLRHEQIMALKNVGICHAAAAHHPDPNLLSNTLYTADMGRARPSRRLRLDPIHVLQHQLIQR